MSLTRITFLGYCPQRFISPIAKELKKLDYENQLISFVPFSFEEGDEENYKILHNGILSYPKYQKFINILIYFIPFGFEIFKSHSRFFKRNLFLALKKTLQSLSIFPFGRLVSNSDIVNIHLLSELDIWYPFIKKNQKLFISYWGSDLLKVDQQSLIAQKKWINRSDLVSLQTDELIDIFKAKHPEYNKKRIRKMLFPMKDNIIPRLNYHLKIRKSINKKIRIAIGYNASGNQNHLKILDALNLIDEKLKSKIYLFISLSYGGSPLYIQKIKQKLENVNIEYGIQETFVSDDEMAKQKVLTDVLVHLPTSDAFSAALSEALYVESIVITGKWLPYSLYHNHGVKFISIDNIESLKDAIMETLNNYDSYKSLVKGNSGKVLNVVNSKSQIEKWVDCIKQLN